MRRISLDIFILAIIIFLVHSQVFAQESVDLRPANFAVNPSAVSFNTFVRFIINLLIIIGIVSALIFLIYGGIRWIISGGDKAGVETARNTIISAIIGLIIVLLSFVIINFVLQLLGVGSLGTFPIPTITSPGS